MKTVGALLLTMLVFAAAPRAASAYPYTFSDASVVVGDSGVDSFGQIWRLEFDSGVYVWGMPGLGDGTLGFAGPDSAADFHIEFTGLPTGVTIDATLASGPGGFETTTRFSNVSQSALWTRVIGGGGTSVSFFAPAGFELQTGEQFFLNVVFTGGAITGPIGFEASWTGSEIPEPGTLALLLTGASAALVRARRRKKE